MTPLNAYQKAALRTYANGDYAYLIDKLDLDIYKDALGDTLLKFILIELSTGEGCEDVDDAMNRMEQARDDLDQVFGAMCIIDDPIATITERSLNEIYRED